jgi:putative redox protein
MVRVCDCFPELKEITDARERRYRVHPEKPAPEGPQSFVEVKVTSFGQLNELVECKKSGHKFIISEPVHVGGQNVAPTPLEFLLSGAVGCYAAVFAFYAAKMCVSYESFEATARADFDVRGHMMPDAPPSGFRSMTIEMRIVSDAPAETLHEIERLALVGCPGIATLRNPVEVKSTLAVTRGGVAVAAE